MSRSNKTAREFWLKQCYTSINNLFKNERSLSHQTRHDYAREMQRMARDLHKGRHPISNIKDIKQKHVLYLVDLWQKKQLSAGTIKNRLSQIRFLVKKFDKPNVLPDKNDELNVARRTYIATQTKAIHDFDAARFADPLIKYSVRLQQAFGLRREESIKFDVSYADRGDYIELKESWTKGGIARRIPVLYPEQRALLNEIRATIPRDQALIPENKTFAYQKKLYYKQVSAAGYKNLHGLRHAYAQRRYEELTHEFTKGKGWKAPFHGGPSRKALTPDQKKIDYKARLLLSNELGHSRVQIVSIYLSK